MKSSSRLKNTSQQEETIGYEKEWTVKKIIIRILTYPLCLFFIGCGIIMIHEPINEKSILYGSGIIIICLVYLYTDVRILIKRKRNKL